MFSKWIYFGIVLHILSLTGDHSWDSSANLVALNEQTKRFGYRHSHST